jgi:hypothetical protein
MGTLEAATVIIKFLFVAGVLAALVWFVFRPMLQVWRQQPDPEALMPKIPDLPEEELQIPVDPSGRAKPNRDQMLKQLREDPRQTALLLQHAIREKDKGRGR